jgi:drug/metabolite transporter (DMT)-like permease
VSAIALWVCLASALGWGLFDALRKHLAHQVDGESLVILLCLGMAPLAALALVIRGEALPGAGYLLPGLLTAGLGVLANLLFMQALRVSPLSLTIPFLSLVPAFSVLGARLILGERPAPWALVGILLVASSALMINGGKGQSLWRAFLKERGSVLMCGVALLWALTTVLDKACLSHAGIATHAGLQNLAIGGFLLVRRRHTGRPLAWPHSRLLLVVAILCGLGALGLQLAALGLTQVSLVETVKRVTGLLMALALGRLLFGESLGVHKLLATLGMMAGVWLVIRG